jgi:hypothetical protein
VRVRVLDALEVERSVDGRHVVAVVEQPLLVGHGDSETKGRS